MSRERKRKRGGSKTELEAQELIVAKLQEPGTRKRLTEELATRLVECGWMDEVASLAKDAVSAGKVTLDDIQESVTPAARAAVPAIVKADLLVRVRRILGE